MKKIYLLFVLLLMTVAKINATEPTIVQYKSSNRCYITITEALTSTQAATLRQAIHDAGYTSVDIGTKSGGTTYQLTQSDLDYIFGETNGFLQSSGENTVNINTLSLKDVFMTDGTGGGDDAASNYGPSIGLLPNLTELTTPKSCKGPYMVSAKNKTIKKLIVPKLGANDPPSAAKATVGNWQNYTALESIDLNTSIAPNTEIPKQCFYQCYNLKNVKIMSTNIVTIGEQAFLNCYRLEKITLPYGLKTVKNGAFYNCFLKNINLPQTLEIIEQDAFRNNPMVRTLKIPASVKYIGTEAFAGMPELDNVYVYGPNTYAAWDAFGKDVVGEQFTYTASISSKLIENDDENSGNHTGWTREGYKKVKAITITDPTTGAYTITYDDNAPRNPAQLHILNTETAKKHYLNPFLRFLNGGYATGTRVLSADSLIYIYEGVAKHLGETCNTAGWHAVEKYDLDKNNQIEKSGLGDAIWDAIKSNDYDTSGTSENVITKDEVGNYHWNNDNITFHNSTTVHLDDLDYDNDDVITKSSIGDHYWNEIKQYDYNGDGKITRQEFGDSIRSKVINSYVAMADASGNITKTALGDSVINNELSSYASYFKTNDVIDQNASVTKEQLASTQWSNISAYLSDSEIRKNVVNTTIWNEVSKYELGNSDDIVTRLEVENWIWSYLTGSNTGQLNIQDSDDDGKLSKSEVEAAVASWETVKQYAVDPTSESSYITKESAKTYEWNSLSSYMSANELKQSIVNSTIWDQYSSYDTSSDGTIYKTEVEDKVWSDNATLTNYDTDPTYGTVTKSEINEAAWNAATTLTHYDEDGNGTVTNDEINNVAWNEASSVLTGYANYPSGDITKSSITENKWGKIVAYDYNNDNSITKDDVAEYYWNTRSIKDNKFALKDYDLNNDGSIENANIGNEAWTDLSSNYAGAANDDVITQEEVATAVGKCSAISEFDIDKDGTVEVEDAENYWETMHAAGKQDEVFGDYYSKIKSYMSAVYLNGNPDTKRDYGSNVRPWLTFYKSAESDSVVFRLPYASSEPQFTQNVDPTNAVTLTEDEIAIYTDLKIEGTTAKKPYNGWNQFLLGRDDAQTDQPETRITRWTDSKWYTLCVPFSLSQHQVQETFGTQTEVLEFTKVIKDEEGVTTFYFYQRAEELGDENVTNYIKPYHPYMIHPGLTTAQVGMGGEHTEYRVILGDLTTSGNGSAQNWNETTKALQSVTVNFYDYYSGDNTYSNDTTGTGKTATRYTFYGKAEKDNAYRPKNIDSDDPQYKTETQIPVGSFFWAYTKSNGQETDDGSFYHNAGQAIAWPQYTAIIYRSKGDDYMDYNVSSNARNGGTIFDLEDAEYIYDYDVDTGVLKVSLPAQPKAADNRVYNLNGQYVGDSLDGLTKGIYIMNGKKYVVK